MVHALTNPAQSSEAGLLTGRGIHLRRAVRFRPRVPWMAVLCNVSNQSPLRWHRNKRDKTCVVDPCRHSSLTKNCGGGIGRRAGADNRGGCIYQMHSCMVQIHARSFTPA